jgi:hypothetical protein
MSTTDSKGGDAATIGVGNPTSGEAGSTLTHETMAETGGSGGDAMTHPRKEEESGTRESTSPGERQGEQAGERQGEQPGERQGGLQGELQGSDAARNTPDAEGAGTAATATGRGKQDTRSQQAGINETGLGVPETGGNQSAQDMAPPYSK